MSNYVEIAGDSDAGRGPSSIIWQKHKPAMHEILQGNFERGVYLFDDFTKYVDNDNEYLVTVATAGTFLLQAPTNAATFGGLVRMDAASTTSGQGINVQYGDNGAATIIPQFIPLANHKIIYEMRLRFNEAPDTAAPDVFFGLSEVSTAIISGASNASANHVGFEMVSDDDDLSAVAEKAGARSDALDVKATLVEDTFYQIGFVIDGVTNVTWYFDGVANAAKAPTANVPIVAMCPSFVVQAAADSGAQPEVDIDWWRCLQVATSD